MNVPIHYDRIEVVVRNTTAVIRFKNGDVLVMENEAPLQFSGPLPDNFHISVISTGFDGVLTLKT